MRVSLLSLPLLLLLLAVSLSLLALVVREGRAAVMSIDLGIESFKVALVKPGVPMEIVLNKESKRKTPTALTFHKGERSFGEDAIALSSRHPTKTFLHLLNLLGRDFDDPVAVQYRERFPPHMVPDEARHTVAFEVENEIYTVEELMAMILEVAKQQASTAAEEPVVDCVIVIPPYMNENHRQALLDAAQIAGLKVLTLMNTNSAVALQYGMARKFNETQYHLIYDMGHGSTQVSLVSFGSVKANDKEKDKSSKKHKPISTKESDKISQFEVKAISFDPFLGGSDFDLRLAKYLAREFASMHKLNAESILGDHRTMALLEREAKHVKSVLSANVEGIVKIVSLYDDLDLKMHITRDKFYELSQDLLEKVDKPILEILEYSGVPLENINSTILMGGSTRIPQVQKIIKTAMGRDALSHNINTDEAAVLGGAFRGAGLSRQFRVKEIRVKDANVYPVQVSYLKSSQENTAEEGDDEVIHTLLFPLFCPLPSKKQLSFRRDQDFSFDVEYVPSTELHDIVRGTTKLATVTISGFSDEKLRSLLKRAEDLPTVKVIVELDSSGLLHVTKAEATLEVLMDAEVEAAKEPEPSFREKLMSYFHMGGGDEKPPEAKEKDAEEDSEDELDDMSSDGHEEETEQSQQESEQQGEADQTNGDDKESTGTTTTAEAPEEERGEKSEPTKGAEDGPEGKESVAEEDAAKSEESQPSPDAKEEADSSSKKPSAQAILKQIQHRLTVHVEQKGVPSLTPQGIAASTKTLKRLNDMDAARQEREESMNQLEAHIYSTQELLYEDDVILVSREGEIDGLREALLAASEWLSDDGFAASTEQFKQKLADLKDLQKPLSARLLEHQVRPDAVSALKKMLETSEIFRSNITMQPEDVRYHTDEEMQTLESLETEIKEWLENLESEQAKLTPKDDAVLKVSEIRRKFRDLEYELLYLAKKPKPKPKKETKKKKKAKKKVVVEDEYGEEIEVEPVEAKAEEEDESDETTAGPNDDDDESAPANDGEREPSDSGSARRKGRKTKAQRQSDENNLEQEEDQGERLELPSADDDAAAAADSDSDANSDFESESESKSQTTKDEL